MQKGLKSLQDASVVMQAIRLNMGEVEQLYQQCADLSEVVKPIKDVSRKHQQVMCVWPLGPFKTMQLTHLKLFNPLYVAGHYSGPLR